MEPTRYHQLISLIGVATIVASLILGVGGFMITSTIMTTAGSTLRSSSQVLDDVASATEAASLSVTSIGEVIDEIESAARSGARTLRTVEELLVDIGDEGAENVASSIDSAVDAMPGIIQTSRLVDTTLNALSLIGVDYEPDVPLDEALESLEQSLAPVPEEIRSQARLLQQAAGDMADISDSSSNLAAALLEIRIDLLDAERLISGAATNVEDVSARFDELAGDFESYRIWLPLLVVVAAVLMTAVGTGFLLIGLRGSPTRITSGNTSQE